jgi:hypothetical protein
MKKSVDDIKMKENCTSWIKLIMIKILDWMKYQVKNLFSLFQGFFFYHFPNQFNRRDTNNCSIYLLNIWVHFV